MLRVLSALLVLVAAQHASASCLPPWANGGSSCYLVVQAYFSNLTWTEARQTCISNYGGDLVSINSAAEQAYVKGIYTQAGSHSSMWIGVNDRVVEGIFQWSDGSGNITNNPLAYTNWLVGEPNDANNEDCGAMNYQGAWNDLSCSSPNLGYICERPSASTLPSPISLKTFTLAQSSVDCGNWYKYAGFCYQYFSKSVNFDQAEASCFSQGATLLSILSTNELNYIKYFINNKHLNTFYIGLNDRLQEGAYIWDDGTVSGTASSITNWNKGEPNDNKHSEDCTEFIKSPTLTWNDIPCSIKRPYMCKRQANATGKFLPIPSPHRTKCPNGYSVFNHPNGAKYCYKLVGNSYSQRRTWYQARTACRSSGTGFELASIHDHYELNYLTTLIANKKFNAYYYWIGLNDRTQEGGYVWSDGTPTEYVHWGNGQPNNLRGRQDCTEMLRTSGSWNDNGCNARGAYICKYTLVARPTKTPTVTTRFCKPNWQQYGSYCYYSKPSANMTHSQAASMCKSMNANLTSINSFGEQSFIMSLLGLSKAASRVHIGINDMKPQREGEFAWSDGSVVTYTNWGYNQPNDWHGSQDCTELDHSQGWWNDINCNNRRGYVCKALRDQPTAPAVANTSCPAGWQGFKGMCYMAVVNTPKTQPMAEAYCQTQMNSHGLKAHLATISSRYVNFFLSSVITANVTAAISAKRAFWFGLNDQLAEGQYKYTSNMPITYTNWARGQPNNWRNGQNCVEFWSSTGAWNDNNCSAPMPFICSMYSNNVITPPPPPTPPTGSASATCAQGWLKNGGMCYGLFGSINKMTLSLNVNNVAPPITPLKWVDAAAACNSMGGNLASIASSGTQQYLVTIAGNYTGWSNFWIGLNDRNDEGGYVWTDGRPVTYTNWSTHQPNDWSGSQDCVEVLLYGSRTLINTWNDLSCSASRPFICEYPAGKTIPMPTSLPATPPPGTAKVLPCPAGWTMTDSMCYQLQPIASKQNTFSSAELKCQSLQVPGIPKGSIHLASVHSPKDHLLMANMLMMQTNTAGVNNTQFWIGLHDKQKEGTFIWTDNSTVNYQGWSQGQPNNWANRQDCTEIRMDTGYLWNDQTCSNVLPYICGFSRYVSGSAQPTQPSPLAQLNCNPGWMKFQGSCYKEFSYPRLDYNNAYLNCSSMGGDLLVVNSKDEEYFVASQVTTGAVSEYVWLGLSDQDREGYWRWADGSSLRYNNWGPQQPNNYANEDCVCIHSSDNMWYDRDCSEPHSYVCEVPVVHFNYTAPPSNNNNHGGLGVGGEAGIAVAVIVAIGVIGLVVFLAVSGKIALTCFSRGQSTAGFSPLSTSTNDGDDDDDDALLNDE